MTPSRAAGGFARSVALALVMTGGSGLPPQTSSAHALQSSSADLSVTLPVAGGPDGGNVHSLAIVATRPVAVFATFWRGGVFKSTDGGASWAPADRGLPDSPLCELGVAPNHPAVLYAECLHELFKTIDGGASWLKIDVEFSYASLPEIAPSDPRVLYDRATSSTMFRSRDGGRHWTDVPTSGMADYARAAAVDPSNPSFLYAGTESGVFKSPDGGAHWTSTSRGLPPDASVDVLMIDPSRVDTVYAGTSSHGMFRTTTGGASWTSVNDGLPDASIRAMALGGSTGEALYVQAGDRIFRSTDDGDHWVPAGAGLDGLSIGDFVADPFSPSTLYAGTSAGVFTTTDAGAHWVAANRGAARMSVARLVMHDANPPTLFAQGDAGIFSSVDKGSTWRTIEGSTSFAGPDVLGFESDGSGGVIARTKAGYFERPRGKTGWAPFAQRQSAPGLKSLWLAPSDRSTMYAATTDSLLTSVDGGRQWRAAALLEGHAPSQLAIAPNNPAVAYAGTAVFLESSRLWRSVNAGRAWTQVDTCLEHVAVVNDCVPVFDPNDINIVYVVVRGVGIGGGGDLIRKTVDGGVTWTEVELPLSFSLTVLPTMPTTLFADVYDPSDYSQYLLLKSTDSGEHWAASGAGLPTGFVVTSIVADPANLNHLFAGTDGRGVFRSLNGGATWEPTGSRR